MKTVFMIPDPESVDLGLKENSGADPISLRQGYKNLNSPVESQRDNMVSTNINLAETDNGGFLGRDESTDSESSKL
jgi:hypothetical protein